MPQIEVHRWCQLQLQIIAVDLLIGPSRARLEEQIWTAWRGTAWGDVTSHQPSSSSRAQAVPAALLQVQLSGPLEPCNHSPCHSSTTPHSISTNTQYERLTQGRDAKR